MEEIMKSDVQIQQEVLRELRWDTRVDATEIGVTVHTGVVTLTGTVGSWAKRAAAEEAAHRVAGVHDVANDVQVKLPSSLERTDSEIAEAVRHALEWDVFVPDTRIQSTVSDGRVTLGGTVDTAAEREDAERAVRNLAGVRGVVNKIRVAPAVRLPGDVKKAIEEALERRAQHEAKRIEVQVEEGRVILRGHVRSWAEKEAVVGAVGHAPGVQTVEDRLHISYD
jgi:osmotically-inducible protein OsmY